MQEEVTRETESLNAKFNLDYLELSAAPALFPPPVLAQLPAEPGTQAVSASNRATLHRWHSPSRNQITIPATTPR